MINEWSKEKIGTTVQAQRKELYSLEKEEQNWDSNIDLEAA